MLGTNSITSVVATPFCTNGSCGFNCNAGFQNCNGIPGDGCETNITSNPQNCSSCGNVCPGFGQATANVSCSGAACTFSCQGENYDTDNNPGNGCEQLDSPQNNHGTGSPGVPTNLGSHDCTDGTISWNGVVPSDSRTHLPVVQNFNLTRDIATLVRDDGEINPAVQIDIRDSATPRDMVRLLSGLYQGKWLSASSRNVLIGAMERCRTGTGRIRALMPGDVRVAHKTGTLSNTSSDVGIITGPDGRSIAVAIYVTGQGGHAGRDAKIAAITRTLYDGYQVENGGYRVAVQH